MRLCDECRARRKQLNAAIKRAVIDGGVVPVPEGESLVGFQRAILKVAKTMNVEISTKRADGESIRVRRFYE